MPTTKLNNTSGVAFLAGISFFVARTQWLQPPSSVARSTKECVHSYQPLLELEFSGFDDNVGTETFDEGLGSLDLQSLSTVTPLALSLSVGTSPKTILPTYGDQGNAKVEIRRARQTGPTPPNRKQPP